MFTCVFVLGPGGLDRCLTWTGLFLILWSNVQIVSLHLTLTVLQPMAPTLVRLLEASLRVLLYSGNFDLRDGPLGTERVRACARCLLPQLAASRSGGWLQFR